MSLIQCTAVIKEVDGWWVGWIEEVPGVSRRGRSREDLVETLGETQREAALMGVADQSTL